MLFQKHCEVRQVYVIKIVAIVLITNKEFKKKCFYAYSSSNNKELLHSKFGATY